MALDFFAIASNGGFPTPIPAMTARMSFLGTWGYFGGAPLTIGSLFKGLMRLGMHLTTT